MDPAPLLPGHTGRVAGLLTARCPHVLTLADATVYGHRDVAFIMNVHTRWDTAAEDAGCIAWSRAYFEATAPFASAGAYVNFMTADEGDRVRAAYGANYDRLARVKKTYDPNNLFRTNWNVKPG